MKLEKASWIAGILAIPAAFLFWYFKPEDFSAFFKNLGKIVWTPFSIAFNGLTHPVTWPVWALILLVFSGLVIVAGLIYFFSKIGDNTIQPMRSIQFSPFDYRTDEIFGVQWIWNFIYQRLDENSLSAFCPRANCMNRLTMREDHDRIRMRQNAFGGELVLPISFTCRNCGFSHQFDSTWTQLKRDVLEEIERRIRTGEFQQRLAENSTIKKSDSVKQH